MQLRKRGNFFIKQLSIKNLIESEVFSNKNKSSLLFILSNYFLKNQFDYKIQFKLNLEFRIPSIHA